MSTETPATIGTDWQRDVIEFHRKFRPSQIGETPEIRPDLVAFRMRLINEEADELDAALRTDDLIGAADALADLLYVVIGTAVAFGIDLRPVFAEIHRSNLTKSIKGGRADGKVAKGKDYSPPDIKGVLAEQSQGESLLKRFGFRDEAGEGV